MRTLSPVLVALVTLTACGTAEQTPAVQDDTPQLQDARTGDAELDLVDRSLALQDALAADLAPVGPAFDAGAMPDGFYMAVSGEELAGTDAAPPPSWGYDNYLAGVAGVLAADAVAIAAIAPPATAIAIAADGLVVPIAPNVWQATNTIDVEGEAVTADFTVAWVGTGYLAEMRISNDSMSGERWFAGYVSADGDLGWWDFYDQGQMVGVVEWIDTADAGQFGIAVTGGDAAGSLITYVDGYDLDAIYAFDGKRGEDAWVVVAPNRAGEVRLPDFNGGVPACWDADLLNTECAAP